MTSPKSAAEILGIMDAAWSEKMRRINDQWPFGGVDRTIAVADAKADLALAGMNMLLKLLHAQNASHDVRAADHVPESRDG